MFSSFSPINLITRTFCVICFLCTVTISTHGQELDLSRIPRTPQSAKSFFQLFNKARASLQKKEYTNAINEFNELVQLNPGNGNNWYQLGDAYAGARKYKEAVEAYKQSYKYGIRLHQWIPFNISQGYALLNMKDSALRWMHITLYDQRFERMSAFEDSTFNNIKKEKEYARMMHIVPDIKNKNRIEGWRTDVNVFKQELKRLNAVYSHQPLMPEMEKGFNALLKNIPSLTDNEVFVGIEHILGMLGHSHNVLLDFLGADKVKFTTLPISLYAFPEGIFVIDAKQNYTNLIGKKLVAIEQTPAVNVYDQVKKSRPSENNLYDLWFTPFAMTNVQRLNGLNIIKDTSNIKISLSDDNGVTSQTILKPVPYYWQDQLVVNKKVNRPSTETPLFLQNLEESFWYKPLNDSLLYFAFNSVGSNKNETLQQFGLRFRQFLKEQPFKTMILDLRNNRGGDTYTYTELLKTLIAFSTIKDNRIYTIIGRNTHSAAVNFAVDLERLTGTTFVGEPFSSHPNTHGDSAPFTLPYSGLQLALSSVFWQLSSPRDQRKWIMPQIPIALSAKDYFSNYDPIVDLLTHL